MIQTLNKHVKWRRDNQVILICDCKRLIDLKISPKYASFMKKISSGINKKELNEIERKIFSDFEKMKFLSKLQVKKLEEKYFQKAMNILDNELKLRIRDDKFLFEKFKKFPEFFIGIFLDSELIGVICGFPREDYLLISEIAIDSRFSKRGFGKKLVEGFEEVAFKKYNKINVGAQDNAVYFYNSLLYKPFLLIQFKKQDYNLNDFKNLKIINNSQNTNEVKVEKIDLKKIEKLRKNYPKANFQYIFTKSQSANHISLSHFSKGFYRGLLHKT